MQLAGQIAELEARREALAANALELDDARVRLESLIAELRATEAGQRAQQRSLLEAQEALASQLDALDRALAQEIARLEAEERRLRQQAQTFVDDRERQAELEAQADATRARIDNLTAPAPSPAAGYVSPLDTSVVLSRFGDGNSSFVSLRADAEGAAVRSVRAGVVFTVAPIGANDGYLVAVRHDATTTTVYTNLRPPVVVTGDAVDAGTVLGYLGVAPSSRPTCCASTCAAPTRPATPSSSTRDRCSGSERRGNDDRHPRRCDERHIGVRTP